MFVNETMYRKQSYHISAAEEGGENDLSLSLEKYATVQVFAMSDNKICNKIFRKKLWHLSNVPVFVDTRDVKQQL